jgi:hypothetical protein
MDLLSVVLEEIYPAVDHIILQEARHTWGQGFTKEKPLYFQQFARKHFARYLDKIRYQEYDFNSIKECTPEATGETNPYSLKVFRMFPKRLPNVPRMMPNFP